MRFCDTSGKDVGKRKHSHSPEPYAVSGTLSRTTNSLPERESPLITLAKSRIAQIHAVGYEPFIKRRLALRQLRIIRCDEGLFVARNTPTVWLPELGCCRTLVSGPAFGAAGWREGTTSSVNLKFT